MGCRFRNIGKPQHAAPKCSRLERERGSAGVYPRQSSGVRGGDYGAVAAGNAGCIERYPYSKALTASVAGQSRRRQDALDLTIDAHGRSCDFDTKRKSNLGSGVLQDPGFCKMGNGAATRTGTAPVECTVFDLHVSKNNVLEDSTLDPL